MEAKKQNDYGRFFEFRSKPVVKWQAGERERMIAAAVAAGMVRRIDPPPVAKGPVPARCGRTASAQFLVDLGVL